ncbi:hypothetical protein LTR97_009510 [Elasticomyces elasticus]|uniref:Anaphase-promoting complex subunit 4 WD40 domain-containing protein n=1 Tax=Elasticomyces elasticus TaxID=574655 RepID=A0AAN7VPJ7_9PEZI|nr:hypothetical protein LTR97_009510 [Elasticomyces elasticus]
MSRSIASFPITPIARLTAHHGPVHALAFSAGSGQYLLTGSQDRSIRLFNPANSKLVQTYSAHGYEVLDLAVSQDNARFASVGGDKVVFVWDVPTAQTLRRFTGHAGRVNAVSFGGEADSVVVSGSFDGTVRVWDTKSRSDRPIMVLNEAKDSVSCVAVEGGRVWAGSVDGRVRCYDLRAGEVEVDVLGASVTSVTPTKVGDGYLVSTLDSKVRLMDVGSGRCLQTFQGEGFRNEEFRVRSTLGMADGVAISGSEDGRVFVWDVLSGKVMHKLWHKKKGGEEGGKGGKKDVVSAVAWNQTRKTWASAGGDGEVVVWGMGD